VKWQSANLFIEPTPHMKRRFGNNQAVNVQAPTPANKGVLGEDNKGILDENGNVILTE
jgi:hypothetical protein